MSIKKVLGIDFHRSLKNLNGKNRHFLNILQHRRTFIIGELINLERVLWSYFLIPRYDFLIQSMPLWIYQLYHH